MSPAKLLLTKLAPLTIARAIGFIGVAAVPLSYIMGWGTKLIAFLLFKREGYIEIDPGVDLVWQVVLAVSLLIFVVAITLFLNLSLLPRYFLSSVFFLFALVLSWFVLLHDYDRRLIKQTFRQILS